MSESEFEVETETDAALDAVYANTAIDHSARSSATIRLLAAHSKFNYAEVASKGGHDVKSFCEALSGVVATSLVDDLGTLITNPDSIAEFLLDGVRAIHSIASTMAVLSGNVSKANIDKLIIAWENYQTAKHGSAAEVLAEQKIKELLAEIDEEILSNNSSLSAGFVSPEHGYRVTAQEALSMDDEDDEDEENDEDEDEDEDDSPPFDA